jgi:hypothetical protein
MYKRVAALCAALIACVVLPGAVSAHPHEAGEVYVPWTDKVSKAEWLMSGPSAETSAAAAAAGPGSSGMSLVGNADKDNTTNSDLAFWGDLAYAGNYKGFRILDVSADQPRTIVDHLCNGPQNDVSVHEMGGKRFLFQSVDTAQTAEDCTSANAAIVPPATGRVGYEGVRVFDVTNPAAPKFIDMIQTACGSHTHSIIPDGEQAYIYVSSYPLTTNITPEGATGPGAYRACTLPHKKISIIKVSAPGGTFQFDLKEQPLSDDTTPNRGFQACHDIQFFMETDTALASCAGDGQLWDISDPWNPTSNVEGKHTHIRSPSPADQFEFIHSGVVSWDGKTFAIMDETGGGVTANCFGDASKDGFYYFYDMVKPGDPAPALKGRYTIPRNQESEVCVSHNATVIPIKGRKLMSASYYQGGVSVVDFTDPSNIREVAYADLEDEIGKSDEWSSYWYNGRIFSNSGLDRRSAGSNNNRGVDVYRLTGALGRVTAKAKRWSHSNPQTQEAWQAP